MLTLVWAETEIGALAAGVVLPGQLEPDTASVIRTLLIQAASKKG